MSAPCRGEVIKPALLLILTTMSTAIVAAQLRPPADLSARLAKARVTGTLVSWCEGQFEAGRSRAYVAAVTSASGGGRYIFVDEAATVVELAPFTDGPDLACYTPAEARKLHDTIRSSETISGRVVPLFPTTVVCAFVENTAAVCWQYSPKTRTFVQVGDWRT